MIHPITIFVDAAYKIYLLSFSVFAYLFILQKTLFGLILVLLHHLIVVALNLTRDLDQIYRSSHQRCSLKEVFLKISQNS